MTGQEYNLNGKQKLTANSAQTSTYEFNLDIEGELYPVEAAIPNREITLTEFLPSIWKLQDALIGIWSKLSEDEGKTVSCRAGCGACCRQLVPISEIEAQHLREVIGTLSEDARERVMSRFERAVERLAESGLMETLNHLSALNLDEKRGLGLAYFAAHIPCPFLDEEESCSIHSLRPSACREYLVTSPSIHCANPSAENISMVDHAAKFSSILFSFADGIGNARPAIIPLVLALATVPNPQLEQRFYAPKLFENFLNRLALLFSQES